MPDDALHLVFSSGSTGGHLFPGLAVAEQLARQTARIRITFAGAGKPFERRQVAKAGLEYLALPCRPMPRRVGQVFLFLAANLTGYRTARRFLRREGVDGVIGLGSYASVPMARAATRFGVPLILLEQNAIPGRATRWLARSATAVCLALPQAKEKLRCRCPVHVTGNPVRRIPKVVDHADSRSTVVEGRRTQRRLLILGGSAGARALNENVPRALGRLRPEIDVWQILHQSGEPDLQTTRQLYRRFDIPATVVPFIDNLPEALIDTDMVVSRAGGTTLSELAVAGVPAVLLPYPHATDDHQRHNADVFATAGGAVMLGHGASPDSLDEQLACRLSALLRNSLQRARMSAAMRSLARPDAAGDVAALILQTLGESTSARRLPAAA